MKVKESEMGPIVGGAGIIALIAGIVSAEATLILTGLAGIGIFALTIFVKKKQ